MFILPPHQRIAGVSSGRHMHATLVPLATVQRTDSVQLRGDALQPGAVPQLRFDGAQHMNRGTGGDEEVEDMANGRIAGAEQRLDVVVAVDDGDAMAKGFASCFGGL